MADIQSPKVNMADDNLLARHPHSANDPRTAGRRWNCPEEEIVAAYLDGALESAHRKRIQSHLAGCEFCRRLVADVVRLQALEVPALPPGLLHRGIAVAEARAKRWRWILLPAAAATGTAIAVLFTVMLRSPEPPVVRFPSAPTAPVIANSEPARVLPRPIENMVRKPWSAEILPRVILPHPDSVVAHEPMQFEWKPVPHSRYYELRLAASDGDLIWQGQSDGPRLRLPAEVTLKDGVYFVSITAYLEGGRITKSDPVRFQVAISR